MRRFPQTAGLAGAAVSMVVGAVLAAWVLGSGSACRGPVSSDQTSDEPDAPQADRLADFVGSQVCATCHPGEAQLCRRNGHTWTFAEAASLPLSRDLDGRSFTDPQRGYRFVYRFDEQDGLSVQLPERFGERAFPLEWAVGSGRHAVTFLTLIPDTFGETVGVEHRVSYFADLDDLDLTPAHKYKPDPREPAEYFGALVEPATLRECLGCHTTTVRIEEQRLVDLRPGVGCESCHGPGRAHVEAMRGDDDQLHVEFASGRTTALEEIRLCGRCHRLPEMLSPGKIKRESVTLARYQPVGLLQSRCFTESDGRLRCSTCHDPHRPPSTDVRGYELVCLGCHRETSREADRTPCPVSPKAGCVNCHMPPVQANRNTVFHDHWIRIRGDEDPPPVHEAAGDDGATEAGH